MDLPVELRLRVYEELVVVGKVFYTPEEASLDSIARFEGYSAYLKPSLAILRVSRTVHNEAEYVYMSQNLFVLPFEFEHQYPFGNHGTLDHRLIFSERAIHHVKHVGVEIRSAYSLTMDRSYWNWKEKQDPGCFDPMTGTERLELAHHHALVSYWEAFHWLSSNILDMDVLQTIELDFTGAYCPLGCCRLVEINKDLAKLFSRMKSVRILGLRHEDEKETLLTTWSTETIFDENYDESLEEFWGPKDGLSVDELKKQHDVHFGADEDPWGLWKE